METVVESTTEQYISVNIDSAGFRDDERTRELASVISAVTRQEQSLSPYSEQEVYQNCKQGHVLIAEYQGEIAGFVQVLPLGRNAMFITTLYTFEKFRQKGVASQLLAEVCKSPKALFLHTTEPIMGKTIAPGFGFHEVNVFHPIALRANIVEFLRDKGGYMDGMRQGSGDYYGMFLRPAHRIPR